MHVIDARTHRILDFVTVAGFALAPTVFSFSGLPALLSYVLAVVHLGLTLLTRFHGTAGGPIPFRAHGAIELVVGVVLVAAPYLLGWHGSARTFFIAIGLVILAVWALSSYRANDVVPGA